MYCIHTKCEFVPFTIATEGMEMHLQKQPSPSPFPQKESTLPHPSWLLPEQPQIKNLPGWQLHTLLREAADNCSYS